MYNLSTLIPKITNYVGPDCNLKERKYQDPQVSILDWIVN